MGITHVFSCSTHTIQLLIKNKVLKKNLALKYKLAADDTGWHRVCQSVNVALENYKTLLLLFSSVDIQYLTEYTQETSGSKLFDILMAFLKGYFEKA